MRPINRLRRSDPVLHKEIVDPEAGVGLFLVEHEVRSLHHPMFNRRFVNRDPEQSVRHYRRGRDGLIPYRK